MNEYRYKSFSEKFESRKLRHDLLSNIRYPNDINYAVMDPTNINGHLELRYVQNIYDNFERKPCLQNMNQACLQPTSCSGWGKPVSSRRAYLLTSSSWAGRRLGPADDSGRRTDRAGGRLGSADDSSRRTIRAGGRLGPADDSGQRTTRAGGRLGSADD